MQKQQEAWHVAGKCCARQLAAYAQMYLLGKSFCAKSGALQHTLWRILAHCPLHACSRCAADWRAARVRAAGNCRRVAEHSRGFIRALWPHRPTEKLRTVENGRQHREDSGCVSRSHSCTEEADLSFVTSIVHREVEFHSGSIWAEVPTELVLEAVGVNTHPSTQVQCHASMNIGFGLV